MNLRKAMVAGVAAILLTNGASLAAQTAREDERIDADEANNGDDPWAMQEPARERDAVAQAIDAHNGDGPERRVAVVNGVRDPWEGFNRKMFAVNNAIDGAVFAPLARGYRAVTFKKQRSGIRNFLDNLRTPVTLVNDLLQGEFGRAGETLSRFVINSTIGFGGMGDPAERLGIPFHAEDFGQTLAVWGVDPGPYLFLPVFGPGTVRSGAGRVADMTANPSFWINTDPDFYFQLARGGTTALAVREPLLEPLEEIKRNSLDHYASFRSFYLQARMNEIANGRNDFQDLPDIGDFDDDDDGFGSFDDDDPFAADGEDPFASETDAFDDQNE